MTNELSTRIYEFGEFRLDEGKRLLSRNGGENIPLTPKIFDTLLYLAQHAGKVISKDELMGEIWSDTIVEENNLNKNISVLRRTLGEKLGEHGKPVKVTSEGTDVYLCCKSCVKDFNKEPAKYVKIVKDTPAKK